MTVYVIFMKQAINKHVVIILVLALLYLPCNAQNRSHIDQLRNQNLNHWLINDEAQRNRLSQLSPTINFIFESRVECDVNSSPIRDCHVFNKTKGTVTVTDVFGNFRITADINDSITFRVLGYETRTIALTESMYNFGYIIRLKPTAYELEELTVTPFNLNLPTISRFEIYTPPLPNQGGINLLPVRVSPITALYNRFSREGRQQRHFQSVLDGTAEHIIIGEKFNGEMVSQITGLKGDELIRFMSFCNFSRDFLLNYSVETIRRAIRQKFAEFVEQGR